MSFWTDWSDGKKWTMGIIGSLVVASTIALGARLGVMLLTPSRPPKVITKIKPITDVVGTGRTSPASGKASVILRSAFVADADMRRGFWGKRKPFVVLARVMKLGNESDFLFTPTPVSSARVVYFSGRAMNSSIGQFAYFSNMPIYGPTSYSGEPLIVDVEMILLEEPGQELLLETLASLGAHSYDENASIVELLEALGNSVAQGNNNEVILRLATIFRPNPGYEMRDFSLTRSGRYVVLARDSADIPSLEFDDETSRLYIPKSRRLRLGRTIFTDSSYFVLEVYFPQEYELPDKSIQQTLAPRAAD